MYLEGGRIYRQESCQVSAVSAVGHLEAKVPIELKKIRCILKVSPFLSKSSNYRDLS